MGIQIPVKDENYETLNWGAGTGRGQTEKRNSATVGGTGEG